MFHRRFADNTNAGSVAAICLLSEVEFRALFPGAAIYKERYYGLTKSFVAYTPVVARLG